MPDIDTTVLDDPVGQSLNGRHAHLARRAGNVCTYRTGVATFSAIPAEPTAADWDDLARLLGSGQFADLFSAPASPPANWEPVFTLAGVQMVLDEAPAETRGDAQARELGQADVPEMLALTELTRPGPFWPRTIEMGTFHGVRDNATLVAMAGERLCPPGWTEISSVCSAPQYRGRGLAATVVHAAMKQILARGDRPFLHVAADNLNAIRLYERLGFTVRRHVRFHGYRTP
ncbi:GNAT family N-acetyltransferase [Couchioplanes azureus]|uniref:GNAT family N-acetyltransferase n=1 Tax=Couchioplanes caeruleus TaxID=56438 RepID=UPI0019A9A99C|nr:GNAT family N-acetyltransferase [Couchioplanes caeruleus]GGQ84685.1 GNAT family N-acetyltransferase [Couchioplanes caeruleus subsp. azureus]